MCRTGLRQESPMKHQVQRGLLLQRGMLLVSS